MHEKFKNKSILILGGGQSTLDVKWEKLNYDYLWTCNDFYLEKRLLESKIDLYLLSYTTDITSKKLIEKLSQDSPLIIYEPLHYRGKQNSDQFKLFKQNLPSNLYEVTIPLNYTDKEPKQKSGAIFRLIQLALMMEARNIYFAGFDGFNKEFSNIHAFTKHKGLKDTDTRRDWNSTKYSYVNVFDDAYNHLIKYRENK